MLSAEGAALLNPASAVFVETLPQDLPDHFDDLAQPDVLDTEALFQTTYEAEPAVIPASSDPISLKSAQTFQETTILEGDSHFFEDTFVAGDLIVIGQ